MKLPSMKFAGLKTKPKILIGIRSPLVLLVGLGAALMTSLASPGLAQQTQLSAMSNMNLEHVMNIGTKGTGEGRAA